MAHVAIWLALMGMPATGQITAQGPNADQTSQEPADVKSLIASGRFGAAQALLEARLLAAPRDTEALFLLGMVARGRHDLNTAISWFRKALDTDPGATRIRLELAYTLFLASKDHQADYHFRLAAANDAPPAVIANIARFRETIRARRAWRVDLTVGLAPDTNINAATNREQVEVFGLPFQIDPDSRARSGVGLLAMGEASVRLFRASKVSVYVATYGRALRYSDHRFDDYFLGLEAGPEFRVGGGRLRAAVTGLRRWYGNRLLGSGVGGRLAFDKVVGAKASVEAFASVRRNDYAAREDVDGWDYDASVAVNRALTGSMLGLAYLRVQRTTAADPGQSSWQAASGIGLRSEIGLGLRPGLQVEAAHQFNDAELFPFGAVRRDWRIQIDASLSKRDWQVAGLAPSLRISWTRNWSTIRLYDQKRLRLEGTLTKAF